MSDSSHHEISVFNAKHFLASAPPERLMALGLSSSSEIPLATEPGRSVSFNSDAYCFPESTKALLAAVGCKSRLRLFSDEQWQIEYSEGDEHWMEVAHYSIVSSQKELNELAAELESILLWCAERPVEMTIALYGRADNTMERYFAERLRLREDLSRDGGVYLRDDLDYSIFCLLETTARLMRRAAKAGLWLGYRSQRYEHSW